ncbi:MAG: glycosyltransferase [Bosea sp. (in: a-proteobacteria)]
MARSVVAGLPLPLRRPVRAVLHVIKSALRLPVVLLASGGTALGGAAYLPGRMKQYANSMALSASGLLLHKLAVPLGRRLTDARLAQGAPRSLWGTTPILTLPLKARADRQLGFESHSLVFVTYYIARDFDFNLQRTMEWLQRHAGGLIVPFERLLLAWAMLRYDVFHYFYDQGLTSRATRFGVNPAELDLLRAAGKRVYLYAYGADVRRRDETLALGRWNFCTECPEPGKFCACTPDNAPIMAAMAEKATCAVALGDMLAYVPGARNMHYWPIDLARVPPASPPRTDGPLRIAHTPNHSHFKGTRHLEATIEKLRGEGHAIDYVKVQGVPNTEVIRLFGEADLIADQFIGGAYGYTALEAMARGKPVMTYVRSPDLVEAVHECPLINVTPDTLEETLLWCLNNRAQLPAIGAQGTAYVRRWHSVDAVAVRFGQMYQETAAFPEATSRMVQERTASLRDVLAAVPQATSWQHPFLTAKGDPSAPYAGLAA